MTKKIWYISIDSEGNYFDTKEQINIKNRPYSDRYNPSLSGTQSTGFFSNSRIKKISTPTNVETYQTSSSVIDSSGNTRTVLSSNNNFYVSSSVKSYKNGVEIIDDLDWIAGTVKISAGNPGHLYDKNTIGITENHIISSDFYTELDNFSPVHFVEVGGNPSLITYPVIIGTGEKLDDFNGVLDPFSIRDTLSGKSIYFPQEPHGVRGNFENGNIDWRNSSDSVVSIYKNEKYITSPFLDDSDPITISDNTDTIKLGTMGFIDHTLKILNPFEDVVIPRGEYPENSNYTQDLLDVVYSMKPYGETYVASKERVSATGFNWDNSINGAESIAFGGFLEKQHRKRLGSRKVIREKDSSSFITEEKIYNDTNTIIFDKDHFEESEYSDSTYVIQYPEMLPINYVYTNENEKKHLVDNTNGIKIQRGTKPGFIVMNLEY